MQYYNTTIHKQHIHLDLLREYKFKYNQKQEVKYRPSEIKAIAIHQKLIKEFNDKKGRFYKKGGAGPKLNKKNKAMSPDC